MAARKPWKALSPAYQKRMAKHGLNARNWNTKRGDALRVKARGHSQTPEHPERVVKNPGKYQSYSQRRADLIRAVQARKAAIWGDRHKHRNKASDGNVVRIPDAGDNSNAGDRPDTALMRRFLAMTDDEAETLLARIGFLAVRNDYSEQDWFFLFYH